MFPDTLDELPNGVEGWQCPDCQSWGPFTVDVTRRVMLSEDGMPFLEDDGATDYDDQACAMCPDCQRQAPVTRGVFSARRSVTHDETRPTSVCERSVEKYPS